MAEPVHYGPAKYGETICPHCHSMELHSFGCSSTLLGWSGGPSNNPNHNKEGLRCESCGKEFIKHWVVSSKNTWYTEDDYVIMGTATCCANSYFRPCSLCRIGWQKHSRKGRSEGWTVLDDGTHAPHDAMYWECMNCGRKDPDEHWGEKFMEKGCRDGNETA